MAIIIPPQVCDRPQEMDLYANFLWLKYFFGNGCVFNYNHYQLSQKTGKSNRFIKRTVEYSLKKGWCFFYGKNLIFKNRHKQGFSKFKKTFKIKGTTIPEIKLELRKFIIENKLARCAYVNKIRSDKKLPKKLTDLKNAIKRERKINWRSLKGEMNYKLQISYKGIGKALNCGQSQAFKVVKKLCDAGKLRKKRNYTVLYTDVSKGFFNSFIQGIQTKNRYYFKGGSIFRVEMNSYSTI